MVNMEIVILLFMVVVVLGLVGVVLAQLILGIRERQELYKLIKSKSLTEYKAVEDVEEEVEAEPEEVEMPVDEIPYMSEFVNEFVEDSRK